MITLTGIAKFHLDSKPFDEIITVQCGIPCGFNDEGQPDMIGTADTVLVTWTAGGMDLLQDAPMSEVIGKPKAFIERGVAGLGLEGFGITDAQVAEALGNVEADWAHAKEHRVGA